MLLPCQLLPARTDHPPPAHRPPTAGPPLTHRFNACLSGCTHNKQERGWSGVELMNGVRDCWVKDIELINPDNGVTVNCAPAAL